MKRFFTLLLVVCLTGCFNPGGGTTETSLPATETPTIGLPTARPTEIPTEMPTSTATIVPSPTPETRQPAERWQEWPVVPELRPEMKALFQRGLAAGNDPAAFMKVGDGEISTVWFLTQYDLAPSFHKLGDYADLEFIIKHFSGSFGRVGTAAGRGYNTSIILGLVPSGTAGCNTGESHLACDIRVSHASFALISMGTNQVWQPEVFESGMRIIIEQLLKAGIIPILSTKADNLEGDQRINRIIARLAYEYNLPLWNFWRAVQPLPEHGMQADHEHLTLAPGSSAYSDFGDPTTFQYAWTWRNLTALQTLDAVYRAASGQP